MSAAPTPLRRSSAEVREEETILHWSQRLAKAQLRLSEAVSEAEHTLRDLSATQAIAAAVARQDVPIPLMNSEQAASYLGIGESAVAQHVRRHEIAVVRIGTSVRFRVQDLDQFIAEHVDPVRERRQTPFDQPSLTRGLDPK